MPEGGTMIRLESVTADQCFGRFHLTLPNAPGVPGYYATLDDGLGFTCNSYDLI